MPACPGPTTGLTFTDVCFGAAGDGDAPLGAPAGGGAPGSVDTSCHTSPPIIAAPPTPSAAAPTPISMRPVFPMSMYFAFACVHIRFLQCDSASDTWFSPTGKRIAPRIATAAPPPTTTHGAAP